MPLGRTRGNSGGSARARRARRALMVHAAPQHACAWCMARRQRPAMLQPTSCLRTPVRRRPAIWLALLAAALNALTPLAAYARSGAMVLPMELCSAATPAGSGDAIEVPVPGAPAGHATHLPHCSACPAGGVSLPAFDGAGCAPRVRAGRQHRFPPARSRAHPELSLPPVPTARSARDPAQLDTAEPRGGRRRDSTASGADPGALAAEDSGRRSCSSSNPPVRRYLSRSRSPRRPRATRRAAPRSAPSTPTGTSRASGSSRAPGSISATSTSTRTSRAPAARRSRSARSRCITTRCRRSTGTGSRRSTTSSTPTGASPSRRR